MPIIIILCLVWGILYNSDLYLCTVRLYPEDPDFSKSFNIFLNEFPSLAEDNPPTFSATKNFGLNLFQGVIIVSKKLAIIASVSISCYKTYITIH